MLKWIKNTMHELGYGGIAVLMCLENVIPPIPSEIVMPLAGFLTVQGELSFIGVVIAGMIGSVRLGYRCPAVILPGLERG